MKKQQLILKKPMPSQSINTVLKKAICLIFCLVILLFTSCGTSKKALPDKPDATWTAAKIIKQHKQQTFDFETLAGKVGLVYEEEIKHKVSRLVCV